MNKQPDPRTVDPREKFHYLLNEFFTTLDELEAITELDPRLDKEFEKALTKWINRR